MTPPATTSPRRAVAPVLLSGVALAAMLRPALLAPVARAVVRLCAESFGFAPLLHRCPPALMAALLLGGAGLAATALMVLARQIAGQRALAMRSARLREAPTEEIARLAAQAGVGGRLAVLRDPAVYAFCAGLIRPRVYVSSGLLRALKPTEVEAVLRHEAHHLAHRDPLRLVVAALLTAMTSPFPALHTLIARACINLELAADRAALRAVPFDALAGAVLTVSRASQPRSAPPATASFTPGQARVAALLGQPVALPFNRRDIALSVVAGVSLTAALLFLALLGGPWASLCAGCLLG